MKQIARLKFVFAVGIMLASFLAASGGLLNPTTTLAVTCPDPVSTDSQATHQMECVDKFVEACKTKYKDGGFCESLSVKDINKCAADGTAYKFKDACMKELQKKFQDDAGADGSDAAATADLGSTVDDKRKCPSGQVMRDTGEGQTCCPPSVPTSPKNKVASACLFAKYVNPVVTLMSALVGILVVIAIIVGAIQYSSAAGDPGKTAAAKERIRNAIIALIAYVFLFSFIQWLIPGGIL